MLSNNRGYNTIQIECRIIFNQTFLNGMTHDFGQILANPAGNIMHTFIINSPDKLCQMAGFNICNIHFANIGENIMLKTDQNFIGMAFRPDFETIGMPQRGEIFKRPGFIDGIFFQTDVAVKDLNLI